LAKAASLRIRSGLSPAVTRNWPASSVLTPKSSTSSGATLLDDGLDLAAECFGFGVEGLPATSQVPKRQFGAGDHQAIRLVDQLEELLGLGLESAQGTLRDRAINRWCRSQPCSAFACWAELHPGSVKKPQSRWTSLLAKRVAADLAARGWTIEAIMTDHGTEFAGAFPTAVDELGVQHRRIVAGRPQTNGCVERVHETILEECWKPACARHLLTNITGLREELRRYLRYYNTDRAQTGRWTRGRTPEQVVGKAKMWAR
jgi:hypothetical protein